MLAHQHLATSRMRHARQSVKASQRFRNRSLPLKSAVDLRSASMLKGVTKPVRSDLFACPSCKSSLVLTNQTWKCSGCGPVGIQRQDIADFLYDISTIQLANSGQWDLADDTSLGLELLELFDQHSYAELRNQAQSSRTTKSGLVSDPHAQLLNSQLAIWAQRRFSRRYERVSSEVGRNHGQQILHKVETRLQDLGRPPMPSNLAIELGGGDGQYLLGFAEKFEHVVFVDGSLANVVLAKALARDDGIANITFVRADITAVPISSSTFSMVHANGVIEHVNTPIALTTEIVRLTNTSGYSVVVSPNRNPITFEPHFRLPLFGLIPRLIRRPLIVIARGKGSEAGTDLLSLRRLRNTLLQTNAAWDVFVIPRGIDSTARQTRLRSIIARSMRSPVGAVADWLINRVFLPIAHSHIAIGQRRQYPPTP